MRTFYDLNSTVFYGTQSKRALDIIYNLNYNFIRTMDSVRSFY